MILTRLISFIMGKWTNLKAAIADAIKTNGNQEITGQLLQNVLNNIVSSLGENASFAGMASITTNPGTPDGPVFYISSQAGIYSNFGGIQVSDDEKGVFLVWKDNAWSKTKSLISLSQSLGNDDSVAMSQKAIERIFRNVIEDTITVTVKYAYDSFKLPYTIKQGEQLVLIGDFDTITCRTNSSDADYQTIIGEGVADRDINYVKPNKAGTSTLRILGASLNQIEQNLVSIGVLRRSIERNAENLSELEKNIDTKIENVESNVDKVSVFALEETRSVTVKFTSAYQAVELSEPIFKGETIYLPEGIKTITGRTGLNDVDYQTIKDKSVADRDIYFVKNFEKIGEFTITHSGRKLDPFLLTYNIPVADTMLRPARYDGSETSSGLFGGYEINLSGLYEKNIRKVLFRAAIFHTNPVAGTSGVIPAILYDKDGEIEKFITPDMKADDVEIKDFTSPWYLVDITPQSERLMVTYGNVASGEVTTHIFSPSIAYLLTKDYEAELIEQSILDLRDILLGESISIHSLTLVNTPARYDGTESSSGSFSGYTVDLTSLRDKYKYVRFRGSNVGSSNSIVSGIVLDEDGNVESFIRNKNDNTTEWNVLPITEKSALLKCTYCTNQIYQTAVEPWLPKYVIAVKDDNLIRIESIENDIYGKFESQTIVYSSSYQQKRVQLIKAGSHIIVEGDFRLITCRTNDDDTDYQTINGEGIADRDINYIKSSASKGQITVKVIKNEGLPRKVEKIESEIESLNTTLDELSLLQKQKIDIFLPEVIYLLNNRTWQLFYRGFVKAVDPYIHDIKVKCGIGKTYKRYYEITPTTTGDYPITIQVRDNNKNILGSATSVVKVIESTSPFILNKNVLCCGASATITGHWPAELKRMLNGGSSKYGGLNLGVNFVGRKTGTGDSSVNVEATGGWTWNTFISSGVTAVRFYVNGVTIDLTAGTKLNLSYNGAVYKYTVLEVNITDGVGNIRCSGEYDYTAATTPPVTNGVLTSTSGATLTFTSFEVEKYIPFYNETTGKVDFKTYADMYCGGNIDVLITHMGVNSMLWENSGIPKSAIKQFIDGFLSDFPNSKVVISAIPLPDYGTNVYANTDSDKNVNRYGTLCSFLDYNKYLSDLSVTDEYIGRVFYAPSNILFDTDYAYPKSEKDVNTRMSNYKELVDTNGVHPIKEGSYMISDGILPTLLSIE